MPSVRLPLLKTDRPYQRLTVCGRLVSDGGLPKEWLGNEPYLQSRYEINKHCNYVRAFIHKGCLHVDLAVCGYFDSPPETNDDITAVHSLLDQFVGQKVVGEVEADYSLPLSESPEFIQILKLQAKVGEVSLKMQGGDFAIEGTPITRMTWRSTNPDQRPYP